MGEGSQNRVGLMRLVFAALCTFLIFLHLLPVDTSPRAWAGPDLILAMTCAWVLRRPEFVPVILIALIFVLTDLLYQMPPGLWAAIVVIGMETLRLRAPGLRDQTFSAEWLTVAVTLTLMILAYHLTLVVMLVERPPLTLHLMQLVMTLVCYPLVAFGTQIIFGVRKQAPGDVDALVSRR